MTVTELLLIRHGTPQLDGRPQCYGHLDLPLAAEGAAEIRSIVLPPVAAFYTSPSQRCYESARLLANAGSPIIPVPELREINFGDFEGKTYDEIAQSHPELYRQWMDRPTEVQFPSGESFTQLKNRVLSAASQIRHQHKGARVVLVTHGGVNRIILAQALGLPDENVFRLGQRYGAVNRIFYYGDTPVIDLLNARQY